MTETTGALKWAGFPNGGLKGTFPVSVNAIATIGKDTYFGGSFTQTGDGKVTGLNNIARLTAGKWYALAGNGLSAGIVTSLAVVGNDLYVGGSFSQTVDGSVKDLNNIARYSGGAWSPLPGSGLNGMVRGLAASSTNVFAGGDFTASWDTKTAPNLRLFAPYLPATGKWGFVHDDEKILLDGSRFGSVASQQDAVAYFAFTLPRVGQKLPVGIIATYHSPEGILQPFSGGVNGLIAAMSVIEPLTVGAVGAFTETAGPVPKAVYRAGIASETGWEDLGLKTQKVFDGVFETIATVADRTFIGGSIVSAAPPNYSPNICYAIDGQWVMPPNKGLNGVVNSMLLTAGGLLVGGEFTATVDGAKKNLGGVALLRPS